MVIKTFYIKSMFCDSCIKSIKYLFSFNQIKIQKIIPGEVTVLFDLELHTESQIEEILSINGFKVIKNNEEILVEQIKIAIIELIHKSNNMNSIIRNSDYLVEKLGYSYQYLSNIFSKKENRTLEQFIILHRIEKVKELISYKELTLSEIAFKMGYSSVQYLSTQFKNITGLSVNQLKKTENFNRISLNEIYPKLFSLLI